MDELQVRLSGISQAIHEIYLDVATPVPLSTQTQSLGPDLHLTQTVPAPTPTEG
jgi:hypothetical protein